MLCGFIDIYSKSITQFNSPRRAFECDLRVNTTSSSHLIEQLAKLRACNAKTKEAQSQPENQHAGDNPCQSAQLRAELTMESERSLNNSLINNEKLPGSFFFV